MAGETFQASPEDLDLIALLEMFEQLFLIFFFVDELPDGQDLVGRHHHRLALKHNVSYYALCIQYIMILFPGNVHEDIGTKQGLLYPFFAVAPLFQDFDKGEIGFYAEIQEKLVNHFFIP